MQYTTTYVELTQAKTWRNYLDLFSTHVAIEDDTFHKHRR